MGRLSCKKRDSSLSCSCVHAYLCYICDKEFLLKEEIRTHVQEEHQINTSRQFIGNGNPNQPRTFHKCGDCQRYFRTQTLMHDHICVLAHIKVDNTSQSDTAQSLKPNRLIPKIKSTFSMRPKKKVAKPKSKKNLAKFVVKCEYCNRDKGNAAILRKHIDKVHLKKTPFACEPCRAYYPKIAHLKRHLKDEHKEK